MCKPLQEKPRVSRSDYLLGDRLGASVLGALFLCLANCTPFLVIGFLFSFHTLGAKSSVGNAPRNISTAIAAGVPGRYHFVFHGLDSVEAAHDSRPDAVPPDGMGGFQIGKRGTEDKARGERGGGNGNHAATHNAPVGTHAATPGTGLDGSRERATSHE